MDPSMFVDMIIRPPKNQYHDKYMGNAAGEIPLGDKKFKIESFKVAN